MKWFLLVKVPWLPTYTSSLFCFAHVHSASFPQNHKYSFRIIIPCGWPTFNQWFTSNQYHSYGYGDSGSDFIESSFIPENAYALRPSFFHLDSEHISIYPGGNPEMEKLFINAVICQILGKAIAQWQSISFTSRRCPVPSSASPVKGSQIAGLGKKLWTAAANQGRWYWTRWTNSITHFICG